MESVDLTTLNKIEARDMILARDRLDFVNTFIDIAEASGDPESKYLNPNQIFCIGDHRPFQGTEKGRQEGHSFAFAADSIARAVLEPRSQSVHISTDKWEAQKKQIYALRIIESLKSSARGYAELKSESKNRLEFKNGSLIDFLACRPPRGADRGSIYMDEMAFMPNVTDILKAALGCTTHGGYIRCGSTHCGASTEFYKIVRNIVDEYGNKPYDNWSRGYFPWWSCPNLCVNVQLAAIEAPLMSSKDRVAKFGNEKIKRIYAGYALESEFQEEFECVVVDEAHAFFPLSLIARCHPPKGIEEAFFLCPDIRPADTLEPAKDVIRALKYAWLNGNVPGDLIAAFDMGRRVDKDEITIHSDFNNTACLRAMITMVDMPFEKKEEMWQFIMAELPISKGGIDGTPGSMGMPLAEKMFAQHGQKSIPFEFTMLNKGNWANGMKIRMQRGGYIIPEPVPSFIRQVHSIKKRVTAGGHEVFDVEANKEHHGDKFWSAAMGVSLCNDPNQVNTAHAVEVVSRINPYAAAGQNVMGIWTPQMGITPEIMAAMARMNISPTNGVLVGRRGE